MQTSIPALLGSLYYAENEWRSGLVQLFISAGPKRQERSQNVANVFSQLHRELKLISKEGFTFSDDINLKGTSKA